ncbi:MAG TPA: hypothetical protein PLF78_14825 [Caulobacter sp.]|nr:hypothetical protein [Caulobacter sp.]
MADLDFEMKLDRMFNEPPAMPDADAFTKLVEMRLDRGWSLRQIALGAAGLIAGLVGVGQILGSRMVLETAAAATGRRAEALGDSLGNLLNVGEAAAALPYGGQVIWMGAALGVMALAFAVTRAVE